MNIYNQNLWVATLPFVGLPRDLSPQNFRCVPMILSTALGRVSMVKRTVVIQMISCCGRRKIGKWHRRLEIYVILVKMWS
jgi:hypothetical protein